jgi:hypothetical protein
VFLFWSWLDFYKQPPKNSLHGFANFISSYSIQSAWLSEAGVPIETIGHDDDMLISRDHARKPTGTGGTSLHPNLDCARPST